MISPKFKSKMFLTVLILSHLFEKKLLSFFNESCINIWKQHVYLVSVLESKKAVFVLHESSQSCKMSGNSIMYLKILLQPPVKWA